jgi:hypothetical protein
MSNLAIGVMGAKWWAHLVAARRVYPHSIEPTILRKKIEDCRDLRRLFLQNETKRHHE